MCHEISSHGVFENISNRRQGVFLTSQNMVVIAWLPQLRPSAFSRVKTLNYIFPGSSYFGGLPDKIPGVTYIQILLAEASIFARHQ
jgi:hypothetical protein